VGRELRCLSLLLFLLPLLLLLLLAAPLAPPRSASADGDAEAREIAGALKCPVCQNISVADSPSDLAQQMRDLIQRKVAAGETREQILEYFVERYGEDVLLDPPGKGFNRLLWWGPAVVLGFGLVVVGATLRRWLRAGAGLPRVPGSTTGSTAAPLNDEEERAYRALIDAGARGASHRAERPRRPRRRSPA
jgi:cytochrome c-type biogenesis protein CcmH